MPFLPWVGLPEETKHTRFFSQWDAYYLAECPHGRWSVWDAVRIEPLCDCPE